MKKLYYTLFFLFINIYCYSQIIFQSGFGDTATNNGKMIIRTSHGEYCVIGSSGTSTPDSSDITVYFIDSIGALTHSFKFGLTGNDFPTGVAETFDGNLLISGTTYGSPFDTAHSDIFACKLNYFTGFIFWSKVYGGNNDDEANSLIKISADYYLIVGSTNSFGTASGKSALALKINDSGDQQWCNVNHTSLSDYFSSGDISSDHNFILGGGSYNGISTDNYVVMLDSNGTASWGKKYSTPSDEWINSIKVTSDNHIIAAGISSLNTAGDTDQAVIKLDSAGNMGWSYNYGNSSFDGANSIMEDSSGNYVICGTTNILSLLGPLHQMVINKIDKTGNLIWSNIYGDSILSSEGNNITFGSDRGFAATGNSVAFGDPIGDVLVAKTDTAGISGCFEFPFPFIRNTTSLTDSTGIIQQMVTINEDSVNMKVPLFDIQYAQNCFTLVNIGDIRKINSIRIYPNPSSGILNIETGFSNATIYIHDELGQILMTHKLNDFKTTLDVTFLHPGIYFLEVRSENSHIVGRFVKQ